MSDTLAKALYENIQATNEVRVFEKWHASSISDCPRAHYFKRLGVERQGYIGGGKMLRWQAGHIIEEVIRPHLESVYPDLISNQRLENDYLTGEYDNYSEAEQTIIEVKSVHDFAFIYRKKADDRFNLKDGKPYLNHQFQNHCYAKLLREQGKPVAFITYVYITLDGRIATYKTTIAPAYMAEIDRRLEVLNTAWATKTPPECICSEDHPLWKSTMQYCDYKQGDQCCSLNLIKYNALK